MGYCPALPAPQLAFARFKDRIRTGLGQAGAVFRSHPAACTVPLMLVSAGAAAFLLLSTVGVPPSVAPAGVAPVGAGQVGAGPAGVVPLPGGLIPAVQAGSDRELWAPARRESIGITAFTSPDTSPDSTTPPAP